MEDDWYLEVCWKALAEIEQQDCNGITQSDYFPDVAHRLFFIFNVVVSHPNMHDYAKSITEPLLNLILLFCEKTRCFYHKIPSRFNANHIDKSQIKRACAAMQACAEFHYKAQQNVKPTHDIRLMPSHAWTCHSVPPLGA